MLPICDPESAFGLPAGLAGVAISRDTFHVVADNALKDDCQASKPRVAARADYLNLIEASV